MPARKTTGIRTTGELRAFLAQALEDVKDGTLEPERANRITKLAAQINESFYSEIKIVKILGEAGTAVSQLGELPINLPE